MSKINISNSVEVKGEGSKLRGMSDMRRQGYELFKDYSNELAEIYGEFVEMRLDRILEAGLVEGVDAETKGLGKQKYHYDNISKMEVTELDIDVDELGTKVYVNGVELSLYDESKFNMDKYLKVMQSLDSIQYEYNLGDKYGSSYRPLDNKLKETCTIYGHVLSRLSVLLNDLIDLGYTIVDEVRLRFKDDDLVVVLARGSRSIVGTDRVFVIDSVVDEVLAVRGLRPYYNTEKRRMRVLDEYGSLRNLSTFVMRLAGEDFGGYKNVTHHIDENPVFDVVSNLAVMTRSYHSKYHSESRYIGDNVSPIEVFVAGDYWVKSI